MGKRIAQRGSGIGGGHTVGTGDISVGEFGGVADGVDGDKVSIPAEGVESGIRGAECGDAGLSVGRHDEGLELRLGGSRYGNTEHGKTLLPLLP